ncbi:uncharacterized protein LOC107416687 [Ziziphus jujuba]|uniref:Uncharacterized protein LOC107416687 n=1 Tax=Ziziphus jujuba TaxID=326968 RepID=A0ABM3IGV3_ZIZJJ|nr:uncharacterized protein LOC107416687 [Ziziphus jujuba]
MSNCTTKVVEYLEPFMSKELLYKFPDNSAFDFDYTQSSIWSPLVPRAYTPMDFDLDLDFLTPKKLNYDMGFELGKRSSLKKLTSHVKKKISTTPLKINLSAWKSKKKHKNYNSKKKKKMMMKMSSDFSPTPPLKGACNPAARKIWNKVLKAASKHFKKKKDTATHVRLSNYMKDGNI